MEQLTVQEINKLKLVNDDVPKYSLKGKKLTGKVVYVYDGDTVHIVFYIMNSFVNFICRLDGIDTPELCPKNNNILEKNAGIKSRNYLISKVVNNLSEPISEIITKKDIKKICEKSTKLITVNCGDFDKYGRLLVELFDNNLCINQAMIDNKFAIAYDGGTKQEFCDIVE
jgi:endonuclease YncB( thermonuclease family)